MGILQRARRLLGRSKRNSSRERRKLKRIACHQTFVATRSGESFELTVLDVGFGGFRVISDHPLGERGDLLHMRRLATDFGRHLGTAYTTGLMVRVAWSCVREGHYEAGLHLPEAPGSMRIGWFKELLDEMGFDEETIFSKRESRRFRCRLPGSLFDHDGMLLDLSAGGGLFGADQSLALGDEGELTAVWGQRRLSLPVEVVGVRPGTEATGPAWLMSLRFAAGLTKAQEKALHSWLEELSDEA